MPFSLLDIVDYDPESGALAIAKQINMWHLQTSCDLSLEPADQKQLAYLFIQAKTHHSIGNLR